jgi:Zn-dependent protease
MGPSDLTIQSIAFRVLTLLIVAVVHGATMAGVAVLLGDKGPSYDGRLSLAPGHHIDLVGAIGLVLFGWGWAKLVDVDPRELRFGWIGIVTVILAGFLALLLAAAILGAAVRPALTALPHTSGLTTAAFLRAASSLSIAFALLSLIPIPPLAGGLLLQPLGIRIPRQAQWISVAVLFVAVATGVVSQLLGPVHDGLISLILVR